MENSGDELTYNIVWIEDSALKEIKPSTVFDEFQGVYGECLDRIRDNNSPEEIFLKLKVLTSCVHDLSEQNKLLIRALEQVKQRTVEENTLLEDRLHNSSNITFDYSSKLQQNKSQLIRFCERRVHSEVLRIQSSSILVQRAEDVEKVLRKRIFNLQNDISGLLAVIRRARMFGKWDMDGINLTEVTTEDIFGSGPLCGYNSDGM